MVLILHIFYLYPHKTGYQYVKYYDINFINIILSVFPSVLTLSGESTESRSKNKVINYSEIK